MLYNPKYIFDMNMTEIKNQENIHTNGYIIIKPNGSYISIINDSKKIALESSCFFLIEKKQLLTIEVALPNINTHCDFIDLNKNDINNIIKIMSPFFYEGEVKTEGHNQYNIDNCVFAIKIDALSNELFETIKTTNDHRLKLYALACFLLRVKKPQHLFNSLIISKTTLFSDKIRRVIENDTTQKWNLATIAEICCLSKIAIRKKLSAENTSFCQILLDVRMKKAAQLLLQNEFQISNVSYMVGISSVSHFIKTFTLYYGSTPKKFLIRHKEKCI